LGQHALGDAHHAEEVRLKLSLQVLDLHNLHGRKVADAGVINQDFDRPRLRAHLGDRKSTRLNSSHGSISYAVFCLKKKKYTLMITFRDVISQSRGYFFPVLRPPYALSLPGQESTN